MSKNTSRSREMAAKARDSQDLHIKRVPEDIDGEFNEAGDQEDQGCELRNEDLSGSREEVKGESSSLPPKAKRLKRDTEAKTREAAVDDGESQRMAMLLSCFSEEQLSRYEMYRRSAFPKAKIKRLMRSITGQTSGEKVVIAMAGISKVLVGEVVEEALDVCEAWGEMPPLQPKHLREAFRRLKSKGQVPTAKPKKVLFL